MDLCFFATFALGLLPFFGLGLFGNRRGRGLYLKQPSGGSGVPVAS